MQEQTNEKISLLIDDELDGAKALALISEIRHNEELKSKLRRYQLVSQTFKNEKVLILDENFAERIHTQVRAEPTYLLPAVKSRVNWQKSGLAIAASIALAVIWGVNKLENRINPYPPQMAAVSRPIQADLMNSRFNDYLLAHDNAVYTNNVVRVRPPYSRVVGYQQE